MVVLVELVSLLGLVWWRNSTSNSTLWQPGSKQRRSTVWRLSRRDHDVHPARLSRSRDVSLIISLGALPACDRQTDTPPIAKSRFRLKSTAFFFYGPRCIIQTANVNPLECRGNHGATSNVMKLAHWPWMGELLHFSTARMGLGGAAARPGPSSLYQM